uniref:Uncharacterized protein n=1 Tax=Pseudictyota dubia TaxID=2749911 RepID=A0A7R9VZE9_9STRA|mmetsp:Transcript_27334/g.50703  ORF Transcript_27334/g.50703 Transcript_27334/m.50703 type:complete len:529 (+) Transcript_27334:300-1886(+)
MPELPELPELPDYQVTLDEMKALLPTYDCSSLDELMGWRCGTADGDEVPPEAEEVSDVTNASSAEEESGGTPTVERTRGALTTTTGEEASISRDATFRDGGRDVSPAAKRASSHGAERRKSSSMNRFDRIVLHAARFEEAQAVARAQLDLGCSVLSTMTELRRLDPDPDVYKGLMEACGRCGDADRATELMGMVRNDGLVADSEMYSCYVEAFSAQGASMMFGIGRDALGSSPMMRASAQRWMERSVSDRRSLVAFTPRASQKKLGKSVLEAFKVKSEKDISLAPTEDSDESTTGTSDGASSLSSSTAAQRTPQARAGSGVIGDLFSSISGSGNSSMKKRKSKRLSTSTSSKKKKKRKMPVTEDVKQQVLLGAKLLECLYPDVCIDTTSDACPQCSSPLSEDDIVSGWTPRAFRDYSTACPQCRHRFVPRFTVLSSAETFLGSQGPSTPLYCEFLSPWVLRKEMQNVLQQKEGIDEVLSPEWRSGADINATLWWNMIVSFRRCRLPVTFLLQGSFQNQLISPSPVESP